MWVSASRRDTGRACDPCRPGGRRVAASRRRAAPPPRRRSPRARARRRLRRGARPPRPASCRRCRRSCGPARGGPTSSAALTVRPSASVTALAALQLASLAARRERQARPRPARRSAPAARPRRARSRVRDAVAHRESEQPGSRRRRPPPPALQLDELDRVGEPPEDAPQRLDELAQARRAVDVERRLAHAQRERLQQPWQPEVVVGVQVASGRSVRGRRGRPTSEAAGAASPRRSRRAGGRRPGARAGRSARGGRSARWPRCRGRRRRGPPRAIVAPPASIAGLAARAGRASRPGKIDAPARWFAALDLPDSAARITAVVARRDRPERVVGAHAVERRVARARPRAARARSRRRAPLLRVR